LAPNRGPVNALLSLVYSLPVTDLTIAWYAVGSDHYLGVYNQTRVGRPAPALDLTEPFRPLIADSTVPTAINKRMVTHRNFVQAGPAVALTPSGRKAFFRAYELRLQTRKFYQQLHAPPLDGVESTENCQWFVQMTTTAGHNVWGTQRKSGPATFGSRSTTSRMQRGGLRLS
jgi:CRISPR/Cas system-associated endonuclease Cas1